MKGLTSHDVRAWCEEWALPPAFQEIALTTYAITDDDEEVLACLRRLAAAQQRRLCREGRLKTLAEFLRNPTVCPLEADSNWEPIMDEVLERLFGKDPKKSPEEPTE